MDPVVTELDDRDIEQVCKLFNSVFGQTINPDYWRWKYSLGPRLGGVNVVARSANGELVGHAGASIFPGGLRAEPLAMAQVCDLMISSQARGALDSSGVYHRLFGALQAVLRDRFSHPYGYGFAGARVFRLGTRMGYYRETQRYRPGYANAEIAGGWRGCLSVTREADWDIVQLDRIWMKFRYKLERPTVFRTGAYLEWRYRNHPANNYRLWVLSHFGRDSGWFITRAMPDGQICIVDALFPETNDPSRWTATLAAAMAKSSVVVPPIYAWFLPNNESQIDEPGIGGEFKVNQWHTDYPNPQFQPGDTDVY